MICLILLCGVFVSYDYVSLLRHFDQILPEWDNCKGLESKQSKQWNKLPNLADVSNLKISIK